MVQEIAQKIIATAKKKGAQDIYFIPKEATYELHMRIGDERCLVDSYEFNVLAAVISHFKFVAGMNVGESVAVSWVLVIISMRKRFLHCVCPPWEIIGDMRVWSFVCYTMRSRICISGFRILENWGSSTCKEDSIYLQVQSEVARRR